MPIPIISIVMGAYNIASLDFSKTMHSILEQSLGEFELIICNDGSTDSTADLLSFWAAKDNRIRLLRNEENRGLAYTLNYCIQNSSTPFIARQDADDYCADNRLAQQLDFLDKHHNIDFVGSNVLLFDQNGVWGKRCFPLNPSPMDFRFTVPFVHGSLLFRKDKLIDAGLYRVSKETRRTEDYELLMRMYAKGMHGANLATPYYYFREDQNAVNRRKYRYRIDETRIRFRGFRSLKLLPMGMPYVVKPLLVGLLPSKVLLKIKRRQYSFKPEN